MSPGDIERYMSLRDLGILEDDFSMLCVGKSRSGKSHFIKWLMREQAYRPWPFNYGVVFSNTAFEGSFDYIPRKYVYEDFNEEIVDNVIATQKKYLNEGYNTHAFILIDDCGGDLKNPIFKKLFTMGRHYQLTTIVVCHYSKELGPLFRSNVNYFVFFGGGHDRTVLKASYDSFGAEFGNFDQYREFYFANLRDHKFLLYNNIESKYLSAKAPAKVPKFYLKWTKMRKFNDKGPPRTRPTFALLSSFSSSSDSERGDYDYTTGSSEE